MAQKLFSFFILLPLILFLTGAGHLFSQSRLPSQILCRAEASNFCLIKTKQDTSQSGNKPSWQEGQTSSPQKIHYPRLLLFSSGLALLNAAAYIPFKQTWWEEERTRFHLYRGWRRSSGAWDFGWDDQLYGYMDKLGHFYCGRILSEQLTFFSKWIGFSDRSSKLIGPVMSSLLMLEIEVYDGFFKEWGFSLADFTANELGAFLPLIEDQFPGLKNFQVKFSYSPSNLPQSEPTFIKDYAGMTFWLSWQVHSVLPGKIKQVYPRWLNLALGYSTKQQTHGEIELLLSPDINWEHVPIGKSPMASYFKRALNYLHFPCFAVRIMPNAKFYPLYF